MRLGRDRRIKALGHRALGLVASWGTSLRPVASLGGGIAGSHETNYSTTHGGLTGIPGLKEPRDWKTLASRTEEVCRGLVDDVITRSGPGVDTVRTLDEVSDVLCQTIDAAEFCRHVHQDEAWRGAAHAACGQLGAFVHELNTHYGLYTALCRALENGNSSGDHSGDAATCRSNKEYRYVGEMLRRDFERFGVHLEGAARNEMTGLVAFVHQAGHEYMTNVVDTSKTGLIVVDKSAAQPGKGAEGLPGGLFRRSGNSFVASGDSKVCNSLLAHCDLENVRREAFHTYHAYPAENAALAERILSARHRIADIMGFDSFASYQLDGFSLANTPVAVGAFLKGINESILDEVRNEGQMLEAFKASKTGNSGDAMPRIWLQPWDRDWAINGTLPSDFMAPFQKTQSLFRVSGFVSGMSALLEEAMGLRLVISPLLPGETWAPGVDKVMVQDARSGEIHGTVYLDLLQRPGKFGGAALFTLRCGKRLATGEYQLPKVALVANISSDKHLSFGDLETLCHEFGHAMHSVLSRTEFQHLSGTRGPQDIIEVPSHVFERFASDRRALSLLAQHSGGDADVITDELVGALDARRRHCAATKLQKTVLMCLLDQYMHGDRVGSSDFGSKSDIRRFMQEHGVPDMPDEVAFPPLRFTHLVGYAGNYYSYLYASCIAAEVWDAPKQGTDGSWPTGTVVHDEMLSRGGSLPAKEYVENLVGSNGLVTMTDTDNRKTSGSYPDFRPYTHHLLFSQ
jgi:intermediate peptidase